MGKNELKKSEAEKTVVQGIQIADKVRNFAEQSIKFVTKKHEKIFLKSKKSKKAKSLLLNK